MKRQKQCKVAFIHPDLGIGGAERLVLDVAVALANKDHKVSFVTNHFDKSHAFEELQADKFPVCVIGDFIPRSVCGICQAICAYLRMLFLIVVYLFIQKKDKPDVFFVDQIPMAVPFIKWSGSKVVYYCHHPDLLASPPGGLLKRLYRLPIDWLEMKGTSYADVLLVNSNYTANIFRQTFPEITTEMMVLYPTISASYQEKVESRKERSIKELIPEISVPQNSISFLSINRFHPAKNLELALSGLETLKQKVSPDDWNRVHLIMAGGYDPQSSVNAKYFSQLVNIAEYKGITSKVTFLKSPSDDLKADLLLACDCLIYTPVNEHFGIVPLEAMIASKPVIACNSGGPCETVEHDVTGYLCNPNSDSLAGFMSKMFDKSNNRVMGSLGKNRQETLFSYGTFTCVVNGIIEDIVEIDTQPNEASNIQNIVNESVETGNGTNPIASSIIPKTATKTKEDKDDENRSNEKPSEEEIRNVKTENGKGDGSMLPKEPVSEL